MPQSCRVSLLAVVTTATMLGPGIGSALAQDPTRACEAGIQSGGGVWVQKRSNPIEACLRAALACREKAKPAQTAACRAKLVMPDVGPCAVGVLDGGRSTMGAGTASAVMDTVSDDKLSAALRALVSGLDEACFGTDPVDFSARGVGFTPPPADAASLADRLNAVPGGLGCLANTEVGITTPGVATLIAEAAAYDGRCVAAVNAADLYTKPCTADKDCGSAGVCGRLALALKEGPQGLSACDQCHPGTARSGGGCPDCAKGSYSDTLGATECLSCPPGRYAPVARSTFCLACAPGTHQEDTGASTCEPCDAGYFTGETGSVVCQKCDKGTFSPTAGAAQCTACVPGTFSPGAAAQCTPCDPGQYSDRGAGSCTLCLPGRYSTGSAPECTDCPPGRFASAAGSASCEPCPPGSATDVAGSRVCASCPAGRYAPAGSAACLACEGNTFSGDNAAACSECPEHSKADGLHTSCVCDLGYFMSSDRKACVQCPNGAACDGPGPIPQ